MQQFQQYIGGEFSDGSARFESRDPATGTPWAMMPEARAADVEAAVAAARAAFLAPEWAGMTASARGRLLARLADLIAENADTLARLETRDTGKIIRETSAQIAYVAEYYRYYAGLADKIEGAHLPIDKPDMEVWLRREPLGVVAAVVPWNSQLFLAAVKVGPALAAGCTVVLKASEDGPAPLLEFARIFDQAGFPPGVLNVLTGFGPDCGAVLTSHPGIDHVAFTGGPETARHVVRNSAENLASTSLELGGKSPFIVFEDADIDSAVNAQVSGIFAATGQSCVAGSRLIISNEIKDAFLQRLTEKAKSARIGAPDLPETEIGPLCTRAQLSRAEDLIAASLSAGAQLVTGGQQLEREGYFFPPTILDCSDAAEAPCLREEFFGPVLSVRGFDTEAEALALANDTAHGLASGVFTRDLTRAHRMIRGIRAGIVWVNTYRAVSPIAPFGGQGLSGHGREGGLQAALDYTRVKTVWLRTSDDPIPDPFVMR
ncbi:aldehyde dehydrogenase [Phaeobacter gallaeciensis]|uniref:NAD-dependent aldehyde dehydrogenase n=1 Tax=Phaeobacter gallaeciensis TaxID=60890 RepID=A0AAC9Z7G0_9RHOB|nr:aldehyde dehydrogenase [Phaeobacter gallaeciensis]AHD09063.1 NAD-dependent aldehyde dehydrogenase [Phaeobacter gallaeciensis DSM 26640]ATE92329.1 NAD-dependent aldehyde dehydrogenase [Phaeobacter gallaeciensis]ATE97852.1 NAD-dependent aldehyde dehydrogenase [Phaeobacter gallaeciensis]ATF00991.1 NAD-dependent aldehyde dehydrogenase [Phaeobacter gallaeciensis]ATF05371.1 NAD-dependent aldehyde dehydrogenase [Phaeobacter gallaeciensis]